MSVTIKQIAQHCGVSEPTVSRILNNKTNASFLPETRERVFQAARELGYRPNSSARAISTGRFGAVALLLSTVNSLSALTSQLFGGIQEAVQARDQHLMVAHLPDSELTNPQFAPKVLREWAVDGLLINYTHAIPQPMIGMIQKHSVPAVWINSKQKTDCIYPDDFEAAHSATEHLISLGHRRICYVTDEGILDRDSHYSVLDRQAGYEAAMQASGLVPQIFVESVWRRWHQKVEERLALLESSDSPTALISYGYEMVQPLVQLAHSKGRRVPDDLSVVTFGSSGVRDYACGVDITSWIIPQQVIGRTSIEMLYTRIAHSEQSLPGRAVPFTQVLGNSVARPRQ